jgi:putative ABC transport system permease protein
VTEIAVLLHDNDRYKKVSDELKHTYAGLSVRNWEEINPTLRVQVEMGEQSVIWIIAIILLGVSFGILNTILMSIFERTRELGMLLSVGMKKMKVFGMVIIETVLLSLTGGVIGLVLSFGLVKLLQQRGVDLSAIGGENLRELGFSPFVYPELAAAFYFQVAILVVFFAIISSIYPAIKAIRLVPAEAVRQE